MQHRRHREFIRLLNEVERSLPAGSAIRAILQNHASLKCAKAHALTAGQWSRAFWPS